MKKNKRGTSTLFLAIILSALILVETTYLAYVADLNRRLTYTRALKEQTEVYLASYDRQLFKTYGIYAFDYNRINSLVFNEILAANGYETGDVMYASGMYSLDTEILRRAVACYYSYRASGVIFQRFSSQIMYLIEQIGQGGVLQELREFVSSPASGLVGRIIDGGAEITEAISIAASTLGFDETNPGYQKFMEIISSLNVITNDSPDISNGFDPSDLSFIFDLLEFNADLYDAGTWFEENINMHGCLADYAANNFDCRLEDDTAIDGTPFNCFHADNESDAEYILTGLEGTPGKALTGYMIFGALYLKNLVCDLTDPSLQETLAPTAELLSAVVTVLSGGTVILPPEVYELVIVLLIAEVEAVIELVKVLNGEEVPFITWGGEDILMLDYRNFLTVFMNYIPDQLILDRMLVIFDRDFPDYLTGIVTETDFRGVSISYEGSYELYE